MSSEVRDITDELAKSEAIAIISRTKYQQTRQNNVPPYHRENYNAQWDELKYMWHLKRASMLFFSSFMMTLIYSIRQILTNENRPRLIIID
jgi:hypothetical protein